MPAKSEFIENLSPNERQAGQGYFVTRNRVSNYANNSSFYALLPSYLRNYAEGVIRPCINWSTGIVNGVNDNTFASYTGAHLVDVAASLITGEKIFFDGNNEAEQLLSNHWADKAAFNEFHEEAAYYALAAGTSVVKLDITKDYLPRPSAYRFDRVLFECDSYGEVVSANFFTNCVTTTNRTNGAETQYWLIESRYYDDSGHKQAMYKVFRQSGLANSTTMPRPESKGISYAELPSIIKRELCNKNITALNTPINIDYFKDGLAVWCLRNTAKNSTVVGQKLGDPFLLKVTDLLASFEFILNATNTDIYIGKGKILVPRSMLGMISDNLSVAGAITQQVAGYGADDFVYLQVDFKDMEAQKPHEIQFNLRADDWEKLWGLYLKAICARVSLDVPSVFPEYYTNTVRTATEVNSEDKLTRRTTLNKRALFKPIMDRLIREVVRLYGLSQDISIRYSLSGLINEVEQAKVALNEFTSDAISLYDYYKLTRVDLSESELWQLVERTVRYLKESQQFGTNNGGLDFDNGDIGMGGGMI